MWLASSERPLIPRWPPPPRGQSGICHQNTNTGQIQILIRENVNISQQLAQLTEKATNLTSENDKLTLKVDLEVVEVEVDVEVEVEVDFDVVDVDVVEVKIEEEL